MDGLARVWMLLCTLVGSALAALMIWSLFDRDLPIRPLLQQDNPSKGADVIILLQGDAHDRAPHAAQLLKAGYAGKIIMSETEVSPLIRLGLRPKEGQMVYDYLTKILKVDPDQIIFLKDEKVNSTREEAQVILKELARMQAKRAILVTSWYHSKRAQWTFERLNKSPLWIQSFPSETPLKWYGREPDFLYVFEEYLKWPYNWFRYSFGF